jgi:hypothetical protein
LEFGSRGRDAAAGNSRPAGELGDVLHVRRPHHAGAVDRDVREHAIEVDVLLRERVDQVVKVMAGDGEHGLAVELRVVEPVQW